MNYQLFHGDCLDVMAGMEAGSVDLTVTSPPYDNLRDYGKDFDAASFDWQSIIRELYRVTKQGGVVVWIVADATINGSETGTSFRQALWAMECGFNLHDTMIYHRSSPPLTHKRYEQHFEYMFVFTKQSVGTFHPLTTKRKWIDNRKVKHVRREKNGASDKGFAGQSSTVMRGNVWKINAGGGHNTGDKEAHKHPAIFPELLAKDHVLSWSNPGDVVFDPMMGSGTTGKMALLNGRRFVGSELDSGYFAIAKSRIEKAAQMADGQFVTKAGKAADTDGLPMFATEDVA